MTGRSRISQIRECFGESASTPGAPGTRCTQPTVFSYANTGNESLTLLTGFNLGNVNMIDASGNYGVLVGDFNGDGRADLIRWTSLPSDGTATTKNRLFTSDGDGTFTEQTAFNFPDKIFTADGCFYSLVMDMNADGLADIVRLSSAKKLNGDTCTITSGESHIFKNNGNNTFSPAKITSNGTTAILLQRVVSRATSTQYCGQVPFAKSTSTPMPAVLVLAGPMVRTSTLGTSTATAARILLRQACLRARTVTLQTSTRRLSVRRNALLSISLHRHSALTLSLRQISRTRRSIPILVRLAR